MADRIIENPIINPPYLPPSRHFKFDNDGITNEVVQGRRQSAYFMPVPKARKRGLQTELDIPELGLTADQIEPNHFVNAIRARVDRWRAMRYPNVTPTTRRLLEYWSDPERDNPILFCQREATETAIYLAEAVRKDGDSSIHNRLAEYNAEFNDGLNRVALKMATGSGKTVVMAMLIAWQTLNKIATPTDSRFTKRFLVVTPGITIRDRLRVLLPEDDGNYYRLRDLIPPELQAALRQAKIAITNFHAFQRKETKLGRDVAKTTKELLAGGTGKDSPFIESWSQMVARVCRGLAGSSEIIVFNDEAHHCYRDRVADLDEQSLIGEDKREATVRNEQARVWFRGLQAIQSKLGAKSKPGIKTAYDLSATPFFLAGSGYREGTLFPWVVSDFSLIDAIESGIVKIPRVPIDDDRQSQDVTYLQLWQNVRDALPKKGRKDTTVSTDYLPLALEGALRSLYGSYERQYREWASSDAGRNGDPPPVFIVVCNNTAVSKMVFDWIAGWEETRDDRGSVLKTGRLKLFSNVGADGIWLHRPPTILVDSQQLESGEALKPEFRKAVAAEIEEFKHEYAWRFPGRSIEDVDDAQMLREVLNTVGKKDKVGEHVRCVVSVSMLTEGWDANTVTHILGVRAFGTQLLCEQVVGRGLRRRSYAVDENGLFTPEYADVYGVPFQFIPTVGKTKDLKLKSTRRVHAVTTREQAAITFPRLVGYRVEIPDEVLHAGFDEGSYLRLAPDLLPTVTVSLGVVGESTTDTQAELRTKREQEIAFRLAQLVTEKYLADPENPRPWFFPQVLQITKDWLRECVSYEGNMFPGMFWIAEYAEIAARRIRDSILSQKGPRQARILPMMRPFEPVGSTAEVDFFTTKGVFPTDEGKCHVNLVVLDGPRGNTWEEAVAELLEAIPQVAAYVKNDHLGFSIPYAYGGKNRQYVPDFLVRLAPPVPEDDLTYTLIVEVSGGHKPAERTKEKAATAKDRWIPAVNNYGGFGRWSYIELKDPARFRRKLLEAIEDLYGRRGLSAQVGPEWPAREGSLFSSSEGV